MVLDVARIGTTVHACVLVEGDEYRCVGVSTQGRGVRKVSARVEVCARELVE